MVLPLLIWLVPAFLFVGKTYSEGKTHGNRWDWPRVAGLAAALLWPLTLPVLVVVALLHCRRRRPGRVALDP